MILAAQDIRRRCVANCLISPFHDRTVELGYTFGLSGAGYDVRIAEDKHLMPGDFTLASTIEKFNLATDLLMQVLDKSSWARQGLAVQNTVAEPGWRGYLTIELSNHGKDRLSIRKGTPIAQVVFHVLTQATDQPYKGRYQNQEAGPQSFRPAKEGDR